MKIWVKLFVGGDSIKFSHFKVSIEEEKLDVDDLRTSIKSKKPSLMCDADELVVYPQDASIADDYDGNAAVHAGNANALRPTSIIDSAKAFVVVAPLASVNQG
jgi:hypothetical protein